VLDTYTDRQGRLLAMPFNSSTPILFYNADILQKAGIAAPPKTWQEMERQLRHIKATQAAECGYSFAAGPWQELENYSVYHNLPFATHRNGRDSLEATLLINQTRVVQHIERLRHWQQEGLATFGAAAKATWASGARTNFLEGKCAFWIDSTAWHGTVEQGTKMPWGGAPLPHEEDLTPNRSMIGGAAIYVFKGFSAAEYAGVAAFFAFLTNTDLQVAFRKATGYVPITKAAYEQAKAEGYYIQHPSREIAVRQLLQGRDTDHSYTILWGILRTCAAPSRTS
jgi:sn-glycerol 3-phosphate transport system substrate-binding protein